MDVTDDEVWESFGMDEVSQVVEPSPRPCWRSFLDGVCSCIRNCLTVAWLCAEATCSCLRSCVQAMCRLYEATRRSLRSCVQAMCRCYAGVQSRWERMLLDSAYAQSEYAPPTRETLIENVRNDLPCCVAPESVMRMAEHHFAEHTKELPLRLTAGQAIPGMMLAGLIMWGFCVAFGGMVFFTFECHEHEYASFPKWLWIIFCAIVGPALLFISVMSMRMVIVPKYQVLQKFTILRFPVPFEVWFTWGLLVSSVGWMGQASTSAFAATMVQTLHCSSKREFLDAWNQEWNQTFPSWFPHVPPWPLVVWLLGLAKLILPLLWIAQAVPYCRAKGFFKGFLEILAVDYELAIEENYTRSFTQDNSKDRTSHLRAREYITTYNTLYNTLFRRKQKQNHGAASMALAHNITMHLVYFNDITYALKKCRMELDQWRKAKADFWEHVDKQVTALKKAEDHLTSQISRTFHASLTGLFVGAFQFNLQVTALNLFCHISFIDIQKPEGLSWYRLLVLAAIATSSFLDLYECCNSLLNIRRMLAMFDEPARTFCGMVQHSQRVGGRLNRVSFAIEDDRLIRRVNGRKQAGRADDSGVVEQMEYRRGQPHDVRDQDDVVSDEFPHHVTYRRGQPHELRDENDVEADDFSHHAVAKLKELADSVDVHGLPESLNSMLTEKEISELQALEFVKRARSHMFWFHIIAVIVFLYAVAVVYAVMKGIIGHFVCYADGSYTWTLTAGCVVFRTPTTTPVATFFDS